MTRRRGQGNHRPSTRTSSQRFTPGIAASVVLVLCAILWPVVWVVGPEVFGRGTVLGLVTLTVVLALVASLVVIYAWAISIGLRPWKSGGPGEGLGARVMITAVAL